LQRGATLYKANCSGCHGIDPGVGTQGIYKGTSADVIVVAYRRVREMQMIGVLMTTQDNIDMAAYITSRVRP
jgi:mono/diheme cytochrome c family protein